MASRGPFLWHLYAAGCGASWRWRCRAYSGDLRPRVRAGVNPARARLGRFRGRSRGSWRRWPPSRWRPGFRLDSAQLGCTGTRRGAIFPITRGRASDPWPRHPAVGRWTVESLWYALEAGAISTRTMNGWKQPPVGAAGLAALIALFLAAAGPRALL